MPAGSASFRRVCRRPVCVAGVARVLVLRFSLFLWFASGGSLGRYSWRAVFRVGRLYVQTALGLFRDISANRRVSKFRASAGRRLLRSV